MSKLLFFWSFENFCEKKQIAAQTYVAAANRPYGRSLFAHQCVSTKILTELLFFCLFLIGGSLSAQIVIENGGSWKYYDLGNEPININGNGWMDLNYDDDLWQQGNAQLGYGDSDENTLLNDDIYTAYFRKKFSLDSIDNSNIIMANLTYDDGGIVYVNGVEASRINLAAGAVNYDTFASAGNDNAIHTFQINPSLLLQGTNVISVEIHQSSASSSDISFDLKIEEIAPNAELVTRGPYLQKATSNSMVIRWRTLSPNSSTINYGTDPNNLNLSVSDFNSNTEHELELTNLLPNTIYYYEIANATSTNVDLNNDLYFKTYPLPDSQEPLRAWILGDCGTANNNQRNVRDAYYDLTGTQHTDMILFLGDNAYNSGTDQEYQGAIFQDMYEEKLKNSVAWSCLGNHDGYTAQSNTQTGGYYDIFTFPKQGESGGMPSGTEAYYSFDYGNIHFIVLESYETNRSVGGAMYNWCQNDIENTMADWIVAMWHHPAYTKGSHDSDTEIELKQMRENFLPMLEANGVDLVLSGHSHSYERSYMVNGHYDDANTFDTASHLVNNGGGNGKAEEDGVYFKNNSGANAGKGAVYITAGSSGKKSAGTLDHPVMYYSVSELGSCLLEVQGNQLEVRFIRETGDIEDYFTIQKDIEIDYNFQIKALLSGNYDTGTNLMRDDLRTNHYLPLTDPYQGQKTIDGDLFNLTGNNAIVDWVNLEFRDKNNSGNVLFKEAFLLQRDGDLVDQTGNSLLSFSSMENNYFVAIRHRNHLGAMTASAIDLSSNPLIDFTDASFSTWGNEAQVNINGQTALWSGNSTSDNILIFQGINNDSNAIFFEVLNEPNNLLPTLNYVMNGYHHTDLNLDGQVIHQGPSNDPNTIFFNILSHPSNQSGTTNFILMEQLP